jgi:hypothetical protein
MRRVAIPALLALVLATGAHAYSVDGKAWPNGQILYYNAAPDQAWAVDRAVSAWNASGANVHFVPSPQAQAQLVVKELPQSDCAPHDRSLAGQATVGYTSGATVWISRLDVTSRKCNAYASAQALTHELGHVLGLGHESRGCATMNPSGSFRGPTLCSGPLWTWDCGLLHRDDIQGAVNLYGGVVREPALHSCELYRGSGTPSSLKLAAGNRPGSVSATFARPGDPTLPLFLAAAVPPSYTIQARRDTCPAAADLNTRYRWKSAAGATETSGVDALARGTYCVAVWALDGLGRPSAAPATAWIKMI